jgi:hypothetical protein
MSARRKHVRAHVHDLDVEINEKEGDVVCRVEDVKGGNVIEVRVYICILFFLVYNNLLRQLLSLSDSRS